jgi:uncharacterized protein
MISRRISWLPDGALLATHAGVNPLHAALRGRVASPFSGNTTRAVCNVDCQYCFFLSADRLNSGSRHHAAAPALEGYFRELLAPRHESEVVIAWRGVEPTLMGLEFFERSMGYVNKCLDPRQRVSHTIRTGATRLTEEWCAFFKKHQVRVAVGIDGPQPLHDWFRINQGGSGTFADVMRGWHGLQRHGVDASVTCTVHAANGDYGAQVYRFFRDDLRSSAIQFVPVVELEPSGTQVTPCSVAPDQWGRFLIDVFEEWIKADVGKVDVDLFDAALAAWVGTPRFLCSCEDTCTGGGTLPAYCLSCDVRFACNGECPKNRFVTTPDGEPGLNYLCSGYKAFFTHIDRPMHLMAALVRQGRSAAEAMALL